DLSYRQLANSYVIGIEIMQGLSGSLGVVLTVPITALIASFLAVRKK
nr:YibE/F family protein [Anaerostipes sp.]